MPSQPLSTRLSGAMSNIKPAVPSSPNLAKSSRQGAQAKAQREEPKHSMSGKENKAPQTLAQLDSGDWPPLPAVPAFPFPTDEAVSHVLESPQASVADVATPMPLTRPLTEVTPDALAKPRQWMPELHLPKETAVEQSPLEPVTETYTVTETEHVRGLGELARLDFFHGKMPVKNTFISFPVPSTARAMTKPRRDSAPKNWAPGPFGIQDSDQDDLSKVVAAFWRPRNPGYCGASSEAAFEQDSQVHELQGALAAPAVTDASTHPAFMGDSPRPAFKDPSPGTYFMGASPDASFSEDEQTAVDNPMVISLQQSLVPAVSAPKQPQPLAPPLTGQQQQHQQQQLQLQQMQQIQQMQAQQQQQQLLAQQQMVAQRLAYMQQMQQQAAMAQQAHMAAAQGAQQQSGPPSQPFQLNLSEWLPSESAASSSRVSSAAASEPPRRVRLEQHLPVSQTLPAASPEAATPPVFAAAALVGTGPGIFSDAPVRRQLLIHNSI